MKRLSIVAALTMVVACHDKPVVQTVKIEPRDNSPRPSTRATTAPVRLAPDPVAASLLANVAANPASVSAREKIAQHYRETGEQSLAMFFDATKQILKRELPSNTNIEIASGTLWRCEDDDVVIYEDAGAALESVLANRKEKRRAYDLMEQGDAAEAFEKALAIANDQPNSCDAQLLWAVTFLREALERSEPIDWRKHEVAIRYISVIADDAGRANSSMHTSLDFMYEIMANTLLAAGDTASGYLALRLARQYVAANHPNDYWLKKTDVTLRKLESELPRASP